MCAKTKVISIITFIILTFGACTSLIKKEIKVYIDSSKHGWYFVFLENVNEELIAPAKITLDLSAQNFAIIKLIDPSKYKLRIYDKDSKEELSSKMKLIGYRGNYESIQCCEFFYPDPKKYTDEIFGIDINDPKSKIILDIDKNGNVLLDSIMKRQNLAWENQKKYK